MELFMSGLHQTIVVTRDVIDEVAQGLSESLSSGVEPNSRLTDPLLQVGVVELYVDSEFEVAGGHEVDQFGGTGGLFEQGGGHL